eukprot:GDKJ01014051.1.p1 GENE.GDKJ01014051.1~~GDKJ01014051.1.p1  ORF type:complete len:185 (-),score=44.93 GDKJ01014051.1:72-626(-)
MGITRDSRHKHCLTGGRTPIHQKKRKFELGRPAAMTKIGAKRVRPVRAYGGNMKYRALRLDSGNFSWGSENCTKPTRIVDVVYNASNMELVRTKVLTKGTIVSIDATPFKTWYQTKYGLELKKGQKSENDGKRIVDPAVEDQITAGRVLAAISSRPGQSGRADGYILEGKELEFYKRVTQKKRK